MNKKISAYLESIGLEVTKDEAYGVYKGYELYVFYDRTSTRYPLIVNVSFFSDSKNKNSLVNNLIAKKNKYSFYSTTRHGIIAGFGGTTFSSMMKRLPSYIDEIIDELAKVEAKGVGYCTVCGKELSLENERKCQIDGYRVTICNDCFEILKIRIERENRAMDNIPNNYLKGFFGALLGALVGAISVYILFLIGFFSAWTSVLGVVLGAYLYKKFGGKPSKDMILITGFTTLIVFMTTMLIIYINAANYFAAEANLKLSGFDALNYSMNNVEGFESEFIINIVMALAFTIIGIVIAAVNEKNKIIKKRVIK